MDDSGDGVSVWRKETGSLFRGKAEIGPRPLMEQRSGSMFGDECRCGQMAMDERATRTSASQMSSDDWVTTATRWLC